MLEPVMSSVSRATSILWLLTDALQPMTFSEIRSATRLPNPTLARLLRTLVDERLVDRDDNGDYLTSYDAMSFAAAAVKQRNVDRIGEQPLLELVQQTGESVLWHVLSGSRTVLVKAHLGPHPYWHYPVGKSLPANVSAFGKAFLAERSDEDVAALFPEEPLPCRTERTLIARAALLADLHRTRARGYGYDDEENVPGLREIAVVARNHEDRAVATISLVAPVERMPDDRIGPLVEAVRRAAGRISSELGHRERQPALTAR